MALLRPNLNLLKVSTNLAHIPNSLQKISLLRNDIRWQWHIEREVKSSYILRHLNGAIYQIFNSGHVNITGLKKSEDIGSSIRELLSILQLPKNSAVSYRIDNMHASGVLNLHTKNFTLKHICDSLDRVKKQCDILSVRFEPTRFPGVFIKFLTEESRRATVILFNSRKFVMVGLKEIADINIIHNKLEESIFRATENVPAHGESKRDCSITKESIMQQP